MYDKKRKFLLKGDKFIIEPHKNFFEYNVNKQKEEFGFFSAKQNKIPARINTSFIYGNDNKSNLNTDIALGFKSINVPPSLRIGVRFYLIIQLKQLYQLEKLVIIRKKSNSKAQIIFYGKISRKKLG